MSMKEIRKLTALQLAEKIKKKEVGVEEAVKATLEQIHQVETEVHSYVTLNEAGALRQAAEIQEKINSGELDSPLAGVPVAVKDNLCTKGMLTTCSSKILGNFVPTSVSYTHLTLPKICSV